MRQAAVVALVVMMGGWARVAEAADKSIEDLPRDAWNLALVWTEPIKQVARETRRFDPISGVWFGLLEGSVKSVERTASLLIPPSDKREPGSSIDSGKLQFRYAF